MTCKLNPEEAYELFWRAMLSVMSCFIVYDYIEALIHIYWIYRISVFTYFQIYSLSLNEALSSVPSFPQSFIYTTFTICDPC